MGERSMIEGVYPKKLTAEEKAIVRQIPASRTLDIDGYTVDYHDRVVDIRVERPRGKDDSEAEAEAVVGLKLEAYKLGNNAVLCLGFTYSHDYIYATGITAGVHKTTESDNAEV